MRRIDHGAQGRSLQQATFAKGDVRVSSVWSRHRLERQKWVKFEWKLTESRQRAKYYQLTALGKKQLTADHQSWLQLLRAIGAIMKPEV